MGVNNFELLRIAESHLGQGGSRFRKFCGLPAGAAWCNAFVCYIFNEGGDASLFYGGKKVTYCPTSMAWCRKNLAQIPIYLALPMDVIYFDWEPNNVPNHIGFVRERVSDLEVKTIEGNTSGGIVANKTRTAKYVCGCFRPYFPVAKSEYSTDTVLEIDGLFGYNSISMLQKALGLTQDAILGRGTIKALQKRAGVTQDALFGPGTARAVQKMCGLTGKDVDGAFGPKSVKALQKWINAQNKKGTNPSPSKPTSKPVNNETNIPTKAQEIVETAKALSWPYGTAEKKWAYKTGAPTPAFVEETPGAKKITRSDCGYFVKVVLKLAGLGSYNPLNDKTIPSTFKLVHSGKAIPDGLLQPGDIIWYKKTSGQHTLIYYGDGKIAEAGREIRFPVIRKDTKKYNADNVKKSTIRVIRAK